MIDRIGGGNHLEDDAIEFRRMLFIMTKTILHCELQSGDFVRIMTDVIEKAPALEAILELTAPGSNQFKI